jgi:hypothetical protein
MVGLRRTKYPINFQEEIFEFEAIRCNAWNRKFVVYYINLLIGGVQRRVDVFIAGKFVQSGQ